MHELSIAQSMIGIVADSAKKDGAQKVLGVTVVIGALSGVEPDALRFCFDAVKAETVAQEATLTIETTEATAHCDGCGKQVKVARNTFSCPGCGELIMPQGGDDLFIKEIEVE